MLIYRPVFIKILLILIALATCGSASAQGKVTFRSGSKYPENSGIDLKKPIGPGTLIREQSDHQQNRSSNSAGEITIHPDSMVSYSEYEGYTIKETYAYDCEGNLLTLLTEMQVGPNWENYTLYSFTYNFKGMVLSETDRYWDGFSWVDYLLFSYTYDNHGNRITVLYNDLFNDFIELITSTYDNKGNRLTELGKYWDGMDWVNLELYTYTYTSKGDLQKMLGQEWDGVEWVNSLREKWTYNSKHKWLTDLFELWDGVEWTNYSLYTSSYNSRGNQVSFLGKYWFTGPDWTMVFRGFYTYDAYDNMLSNVQQYYIDWETPPYWENTDSTANEFDYPAQMVTGLGYVWDGRGWIPGETSIYIPFMDNGNKLVFANEFPSHKVEVFYSPVEFEVEAGENATIYIGYPPTSCQLHATGAESYSWSPAEGLSDPNVSDPIAGPSHTTVYKVTGTNLQGCTATDKVKVTVIDVRCGKKLDKVLVCLVPPGNPHNSHTVCVSPNAVPSLLANGSYLGPCQCDDSPSILAGTMPGEFTLEAGPNPVSGAFVIRVNTPLTEHFDLNLYDTQGRLIQKIFNGELEAGEHQIEVGSIESALKGMFFLRAVSPTVSQTVKLIRL